MSLNLSLVFTAPPIGQLGSNLMHLGPRAFMNESMKFKSLINIGH